MKKILLIILGILVALVLSAYVWVSSNSDKIFQLAEDSLAKQGILLSDNSDFSVGIFPSPTLKILSTEITAEQVAADIDHLDIAVSWSSIFSSELVIKNILISGAHILIFDQASASAPQTESSIESESTSTGQSNTDVEVSVAASPGLKISRIRLDDVSVTIDQQGHPQIINIASLSADNFNLSREPFSLDLEVGYGANEHAVTLELEAEMRLGDEFFSIDNIEGSWIQNFNQLAQSGDIKGSATLDGTAIDSDLSLSFDNVQVDLNTKISELLKDGTIDLKLTSESLDKLLVLEQTGFDQPTQLNYHVKMSNGVMTIASSDSTLNGEALSTNIIVNTTEAIPTIRGDIELAAVSWNTAKESDSDDTDHAASSQTKPLDLQALNSLDLAIKMRLGTLNVDHIQVTQIDAEVVAQASGLEINLNNASIAKGITTGRINLSNSLPVHIDADLQLTSIELADLSKALDITTPLDGGYLNGGIDASFSLNERPITTLNSDGKLTISNTVLVGNNLSARACQAVSLARNQTYDPSPFGADTEIDSIMLPIKVNDGIAAFDGIQLDSDLIQANGDGTLNLPASSGSIDFDVRLKPALVANCPAVNARLQRVDIPLSCELNEDSSVSCGVNSEKIGELIRDALSDSLRNRVQDALNDLFK